MKEFLLLGDEAIAQGALDAGMSGIYAYPGTPSTEITEYVQRSPQAKLAEVHSEWSANEKTAMEEAIGMSYAGKRAMVCMKHVGLNVAADAFINGAITGANGGLLIVVADDPSMHSSQNEQDSRYYGRFAMLPILEPSSQQEAYDMAYIGFELSERHHLPVLIRLTTRLAHSRTLVFGKEMIRQNEIQLPDNLTQYVLLPALARGKYRSLIEKQQLIEKESERSEFNQYIEGDDVSKGIITCGISYNYLVEAFENEPIPYPVLKIGQYPVPIKLMKRMVAETDELVILEEGYPFIEEMLASPIHDHRPIHGRLDGTLPRTGELNPRLVAKAFNRDWDTYYSTPDWLMNRPPSMCKGCTHIEVFNELNEALEEYGEGRVFSDIGCYTLGALPPFNAINSCVDMGASITMAKGAADAGLKPAVAVIGDSTFTHSGMTGLLDAIYENSPITVIISDNATTAMTGGQTSLGTGRLDKICIGLGVDPKHVHTFEPSKKNRKEIIALLHKELAYDGLSVIIPNRECVQTAQRAKKERKLVKEIEVI
jgi:indolepyruvate ferredoxin oxidoreductase alpha subunit